MRGNLIFMIFYIKTPSVMNATKVLIVATTSYAGMGPYVSTIVNSFSQDDNILFFFRDYRDLYYTNNVKKELTRFCTFLLEPDSMLNKFLELFLNRSLYDDSIIQLCKEKNIKLVHFINGSPNLNILKELSKIGVKVLSTVHDLNPHEAKKAWYKMLKHRLFYYNVRKSFENCNYVVTNSKYQYSEILHFYPSKRTYFHPFPTLVTDRIKNGTEELPELTSIDKPYILFFGRLEEYKGVHLLYDAFINSPKLFNNFDLVIAGSGYNSCLSKNEFSNIIYINRYIKDEEIKSLFKNAKCAVFPYISATQSGVLSQAFYFQCPTLTSDVPFFLEIITNNNTGLTFKANDNKDLQEKLEELVQADNKNMRINQISFYNQYYDVSVIRNTLIRIYQDILSE